MQWNVVTWYSKLAAAFIFVATLALGGYLGIQYQKTQDAPKLLEQEGTIASLQLKLLPLKQVTSPPVITLSAPANGAILCRGTDLAIQWHADPSVDEVFLDLEAPLPPSPFGVYPASYNDEGTEGLGVIHWTVGTYSIVGVTYPYPDAGTYRITARATSHGKIVGTADSGVFTVQTCNGG